MFRPFSDEIERSGCDFYLEFDEERWVQFGPPAPYCQVFQLLITPATHFN